MTKRSQAVTWRLCLSLCDGNAADTKDATPDVLRSVCAHGARVWSPACTRVLATVRPPAVQDVLGRRVDGPTRARTCERRAPGLPRAERCHRLRMIWEVMPTLQTRQDQSLMHCLHRALCVERPAQSTAPRLRLQRVAADRNGSRVVRPPAAGLPRSQQCGFGGRGPPPC